MINVRKRYYHLQTLPFGELKEEYTKLFPLTNTIGEHAREGMIWLIIHKEYYSRR